MTTTRSLYFRYNLYIFKVSSHLAAYIISMIMHHVPYIRAVINASVYYVCIHNPFGYYRFIDATNEAKKVNFSWSLISNKF